MKTMISLLTLATLSGLCLSCSDNEDNLPQKDWEGTSTYFASTDEKVFGFYYKPYVGYVGDPMPFYDEKSGEFKVLYLQDFRPNPTYTYHPIWGLSTDDATHYSAMGELVSCGGQYEQDAALGTGSTVYNSDDQHYYTFYTGHDTNANEAVMVSASADFQSWSKDRSFCLKGGDYGYDTRDFRDPFVFRGDDNVWHMLVSTKKNGKGVLAEFTSSDLLHWNDAGVFMYAMWDRFYECPDLFKMGDWWYLIYSDQLTVRRTQYFKGRTLDELKACTLNDAGLWPDDHEGFLDSRGFYAGKTASNGTDRYIWGWCPTRTGNNNTATSLTEWAGNLVAHRLIQHEDGTLTLGEVEGIKALFTATNEVQVMDKAGETSGSNGNYTLQGDAHLLFGRLKTHNRISFTVTTESDEDRFGISLVRGSDSDKYYTLIINPEGPDRRKINFEEEGGQGFVADIDSYMFDRPTDNTYRITVYTDNSVCVVYINDQVAYTNHIHGIAKNCWSINSYGGNITVNQLQISHF